MKKLIIILAFLGLSGIGFSNVVTINNSGLTFVPATVTILPGDSVNFTIGSVHTVIEVSQSTWSNNGNTQLPGGFVTPSGGGLIDPTRLSAGTHWYVCLPHAASGMKGRIIVQSTTGIPQNELKNNFIVHCNPSNWEVSVKFDKMVNGTLQLCNLQGKVLEQAHFNSEDYLVELGDRPKGIYFILVTDESGNKAISKIMKM